MSEYLIQEKSLTDIADAIREKAGTTEKMTPAEMAEAITAIRTGGSDSAVAQKDVNFYDYDGTLLYSYTIAEAQALTELPAAPEHDGLTFQQWNWSLENINALTRAMNVGATYITDDGKTRIHIRLTEGLTSPMLGVCPNGTVDVDWGDGTAHDTLTGTSTWAVQWTPNHEYAAPGEYVITLTVDGEMSFYGKTSTNIYSSILRHSSEADGRNTAYLCCVTKLFIGNGVKSTGDYAFYYCCNLGSVTIPNGVTSIGSGAFDYCYSLGSAVIPDGVTNLASNAFYYCHSLDSVAIPDGVTSIGGSAFNNCYTLANVTIPDGVTSIGNEAFNYCYSLGNGVIIPDGVTSIGKGTFFRCLSLGSVTIPGSVTSISNEAFLSCFSVRFYDFTHHTAVPTLSATNAFNNIAADCEIRVPAALYDEWISATNWATYASKIVAA